MRTKGTINHGRALPVGLRPAVIAVAFELDKVDVCQMRRSGLDITELTFLQICDRMQRTLNRVVQIPLQPH